MESQIQPVNKTPDPPELPDWMAVDPRDLAAPSAQPGPGGQEAVSETMALPDTDLPEIQRPTGDENLQVRTEERRAECYDALLAVLDKALEERIPTDQIPAVQPEPDPTAPAAAAEVRAPLPAPPDADLAETESISWLLDLDDKRAASAGAAPVVPGSQAPSVLLQAKGLQAAYAEPKTLTQALTRHGARYAMSVLTVFAILFLAFMGWRMATEDITPNEVVKELKPNGSFTRRNDLRDPGQSTNHADEAPSKRGYKATPKSAYEPPPHATKRRGFDWSGESGS